jgi:hypothetical protein
MSRLGQTLQVVCRWARRELRLGPKTDSIPMPNPVAQLLALFDRAERTRCDAQRLPLIYRRTGNLRAHQDQKQSGILASKEMMPQR